MTGRRSGRAATPRTGFAYLDDPVRDGTIVAMAHRGGALHPDVVGFENTMHAFEVAVGLGFHYLETDVHATRDGHLLAFHDAQLDRVTDRAGHVEELTRADLAGLRVGGREPIPLLTDLLEAFPAARFNIDLKAPGSVDLMADLVERMRLHDRVCVGSFTERSLRRFRSRVRRPVATARGIAAVAVDRYVPGGMVLGRVLRDPGAVYQVPVRYKGRPFVDQRFIDRAHAAGRHVHAWTVDEPAEMERLIDMGVDGLLTDRPDVLRDVLERRGLWWR